jgi:hypothetical protein
MAGLTNLKLLTDFFNKIGHQRTFRDAHVTSASSPQADIELQPLHVG